VDEPYRTTPPWEDLPSPDEGKPWPQTDPWPDPGPYIPPGHEVIEWWEPVWIPDPMDHGIPRPYIRRQRKVRKKPEYDEPSRAPQKETQPSPKEEEVDTQSTTDPEADSQTDTGYETETQTQTEPQTEVSGGAGTNSATQTAGQISGANHWIAAVAAAVLASQFGNVETQIRTDIRLRQIRFRRTETRPSPQKTSRVESRLRKDGKSKWQEAYLAGLLFVNKWYGPISEAKDFLDVLKENLIINGRRMNKYESLDTWWKSLVNMDHDVELDMDGFLIGLMEEYLTDLLIGKMSQKEKELLLKHLGPSHWVVNAFGNPRS
jgi:hypothetical protein